MRTYGGMGEQEQWVRGTLCPGTPPYLPLLAFWVLEHPEEGDRIVELPELQERGE